jgi:membrane-associated phospholipid phosphatase
VDGRIERAIHAFVLDHPWLADVAHGVTHLGDPLVVTLVTLALAVLLWWRGNRKAALVVLAVRILAIAVDDGVKFAVRRARPVLAHPVAHAHGYSFPSGHAVGSAALWATFAFLARSHGMSRARAVTLAVVVPVVVATTRVLLGVHYVTDVVAGLVLGWLCAGIAFRLTR